MSVTHPCFCFQAVWSSSNLCWSAGQNPPVLPPERPADPQLLCPGQPVPALCQPGQTGGCASHANRGTRRSKPSIMGWAKGLNGQCVWRSFRNQASQHHQELLSQAGWVVINFHPGGCRKSPYSPRVQLITCRKEKLLTKIIMFLILNFCPL